MIEKILKDRLTSIELYQDKLKKYNKKLNRYKKADNELIAKKTLELENSIREVLAFTKNYHEELTVFLKSNQITFDLYQAKFTHYDEKFREVLESIQKKEDEFKSLEYN